MWHLTATSTIWLAHSPQKLWGFALLTLTFAVLGRLVRGVTTGGAIAGATICFALLWGAGISGFAALFTVFLLTWISTRIGYAKKQTLGTAEARAGRNAFQVFANLGIAGACALLYSVLGNRSFVLAMAAALAEAAADTVSSEIGQAFGGAPRLITNWRKVSAGIDGAISIAGTLAGIASAIVVALISLRISSRTAVLELRFVLICAGAGVLGMLFDSLLGATLERDRKLDNNAVNFLSTALAAMLAFLIS